MNVLDENIPEDQREILNAWRIRTRSVGREIAYPSALDEALIVALHRLKQPTFFTRDQDFFRRELLHVSYGLVWLDLKPIECASYIRKFLRHPAFRTKAQRKGIVARVSHDGISFWRENTRTLQRVRWAPDKD